MPHVTAVYAAGHDPLSALGRLMTMNATWNHCGIVVGGDVIEARMWFGVVRTPIEEFKKRCPHHEFVQIRCPNPAKAHAQAIKNLGKKYDYLSALGIPFRSEREDPSRLECFENLESCLHAGESRRWRNPKVRKSPQESYDVL